MDFKKKFDYNDINNFLPDNMTVGRSEYFKNKFNDKLPSHVCEMLEVKSRIEFDDEKQNEDIIQLIKEKKRNRIKNC